MLDDAKGHFYQQETLCLFKQRTNQVASDKDILVNWHVDVERST